MQRRYDRFTINLKKYVTAKENRLLREEINPTFKDVQSTEEIVEYIKSHEVDDKAYYFLAKFEIQNQLIKLEKYFPHCTAAMWLLCREEDELYMFASPHLRDELDIQYGVQFGDKQKYHAPYRSIESDMIVYLDFLKPPTVAIAEASKLWVEYGYKSVWTIPFHLEGKPIGSLGLVFDLDIGRLPLDAELQLINETLAELEDHFRTILLEFDQYKDRKTKKIVG